MLVLSRAGQAAGLTFNQPSESLSAVSYTHLDVYKRQTGLSVDAVTGTEAAVFEGQSGIEAGLADALINASDAISAVSYTHLDVYKRQPFLSNPIHGSCLNKNKSIS